MPNHTPPQIRDGFLDSQGNLTLEAITTWKRLTNYCEDDRRADPETYKKCPRCYAHHSVRGNFDNLCDRCCRTILEHFPEHASVPHIKASLERWHQ